KALDPEMLECKVELARCYQQICSWDELEQLMPTLQGEFDKAVAGQPCTISAFFGLSLPFKPEERAAVTRDQSQKAALRPAPEWRGAAPLVFTGSKARDRLRIAYLSSDLREHPMSHLISYLFSAHDRAHVSIDVYSMGPDDGSIYRQRIAQDAD